MYHHLHYNNLKFRYLTLNRIKIILNLLSVERTDNINIIKHLIIAMINCTLHKIFLYNYLCLNHPEINAKFFFINEI